jgi:hypothetical protein
VTPAEIFAIAAAHGVEIRLNNDGGLSLLVADDPPEDFVALVRANKPAVIDAIRWGNLLREKIATIMKMRDLSGSGAKPEAFRHILIEYLDESHPHTDPRFCAHCHGLNLPLTPTLPYGVGDRHTWLHPRCWEPWSERRTTEAIAALAAMGIESTPG